MKSNHRAATFPYVERPEMPEEEDLTVAVEE